MRLHACSWQCAYARAQLSAVEAAHAAPDVRSLELGGMSPTLRVCATVQNRVEKRLRIQRWHCVKHSASVALPSRTSAAGTAEPMVTFPLTADMYACIRHVQDIQ